MRNISVLLSMIVLVALGLTACGGGATSTNVVESPPPVTVDSTEDMSGTATESATEAPTDIGATTGTPGVPVTGQVNPARLSNQLDFKVWSQDGEQIGEVDDMVLDLDNTQIAYVVVGTGGFLDLGERDILVPWNSLQLQTGTGETTGGQENAFILQTDVDVFRNAPDFDLNANLPQAGQAAGDWDVDISTYWESGGATGGTANTPAAGETEAPIVDMTSTGTTTDIGQATATGEGTGLGTETLTVDQGTGENLPGGQALQGVVLATEVLDSPITLSPGQGQEQGQATADPNATAAPNVTTDPNATADPNATGTTGAGQEQGQGVGNIEGTIDDMIVAVDTGEIQYLVVDVTLDERQRWIPVPLSFIQWDAADGAFLINANPATFRDAPYFENGQYPDTTVSGWNSEFDTFWQSQ
ncbi:MAG TPA: PRC-barrel domain-containing protein [Anaerolineales bacterium]|nr:PRC-barrel domain-containing protein [Anaerolineales bacterium]